jgi:hypothetical protein
MKPDAIPYKGPSSGAVKLESKTLEKVIEAGVPGIGYTIKRELARRSAVHIAIRAM